MDDLEQSIRKVEQLINSVKPELEKAGVGYRVVGIAEGKRKKYHYSPSLKESEAKSYELLGQGLAVWVEPA
jgi:hypothetical protein|tara:strand:- start:226 stop:438 length:213 start_codon:yes stop_codon:yes gene_type:complete